MAYARCRSTEEAVHQALDSHQVQWVGGMDEAMLELEDGINIWRGRGLL